MFKIENRSHKVFVSELNEMDIKEIAQLIKQKQFTSEMFDKIIESNAYYLTLSEYLIKNGIVPTIQGIANMCLFNKGSSRHLSFYYIDRYKCYFTMCSILDQYNCCPKFDGHKVTECLKNIPSHMRRNLVARWLRKKYSIDIELFSRIIDTIIYRQTETSLVRRLDLLVLDKLFASQ